MNAQLSAIRSEMINFAKKGLLSGPGIVHVTVSCILFIIYSATTPQPTLKYDRVQQWVYTMYYFVTGWLFLGLLAYWGGNWATAAWIFAILGGLGYLVKSILLVMQTVTPQTAAAS